MTIPVEKKRKIKMLKMNQGKNQKATKIRVLKMVLKG